MLVHHGSARCREKKLVVYAKFDSDSLLHPRMVTLGLEVGGYVTVLLPYFVGVGTETTISFR